MCAPFTDTGLLGEHNITRETHRMSHLYCIKTQTCDTFNGTAHPWVCICLFSIMGLMTLSMVYCSETDCYRRYACQPTCHLGPLPYCISIETFRKATIWRLTHTPYLVRLEEYCLVWYPCKGNTEKSSLLHKLHYTQKLLINCRIK